jgi:fluoride exporter
MHRFVLVGVAGLVGTLARYLISVWIDNRINQTFPFGTVVVNLFGCFLAGYLFHLTEEKYPVDAVVRTAIFVGFLGGFTTFSSYGLQTINMIRDGSVLLAGANILISNLAGLMLVWAGYAIVRVP